MNVIIYVLDQLRPDFLSCYGFNKETSPNIDAIAKDGVLFKNAYATSSWTKPSGASILTGQYPRGIKMMHKLDMLPENVPTLPEFLVDKGFKCFGITANAFISNHFGLAKGFDHFINLRESDELRKKGRKLVKGEISKDPLPLPESQDLNDALFNLNVDLKKPTFLFFWSIDTHNPYFIRGERSYFGNPKDCYISHLEYKKYLNPEGIKLLKSIYCDMIRHNDNSLGELINYLKEEGVYESTLIIITSDHGEGFLEHGHMGHAGIVYEEQVKVPLIIKFPNNDYKGTVVKQTVSLVDIVPTVLDMIDNQSLKLATFDGTSLLSAIKGKVLERPVLCETQYEPHTTWSASLRLGKWKLMQVRFSMKIGKSFRSIAQFLKNRYLSWRWKHPVLYDLEADPNETRPISNSTVKEITVMRDKLNEILTTLDKRCSKLSSRKWVRDDEVLRRLKDLGYM